MHLGVSDAGGRTLRQRTVSPSGGGPTGARRALAALTVAALFAACGTAEPDAPAPEVGQARLALSAPNSSGIARIDYTLTFTFLQATPPQVYLVEEYSSARHGGELVAILPCYTTGAGTGINQVDVVAEVHFDGDAEPVTVNASAVFECVRNADTRVNIVLNLVGALNAGFVDLDIAASGTLCASKVDFHGDGHLGVCPDASCGDAEAMFLFANTCQAVGGGAPEFWVCGAPTDWIVSQYLANSQFPVPQTDGRWEFGVVALDKLHMIQDDPTLTDAEGFLKVWTGVASTRAVLERQGGENVLAESRVTMRDFAAELRVPPQSAGQPSPRLLLLGTNATEGARITFQGEFGACDLAVQGTDLYAGFRVADVRLDGPSKVRLLMTDAVVTYVRTVATCEAGWDAADRPTVVCGPPGPLF